MFFGGQFSSGLRHNFAVLGAELVASLQLVLLLKVPLGCRNAISMYGLALFQLSLRNGVDLDIDSTALILPERRRDYLLL